MNNINIPYIDRLEGDSLFNKIVEGHQSKSIIVHGVSGTGKTSLVKHTISKIIQSDLQNDYIIISLNLVDDHITPTIFFELLIFLLWNGDVHDVETMINLDKSDSFSKFLNNKKINKRFSKILYQSVLNSISLIPTYAAQISSTVVNGLTPNFELDKIELLRKYFKSKYKKKKVVLVIDNYQNMTCQIRYHFESLIGDLNKNMVLISIFRTLNILSKFEFPICFTNERTKILLDNFSLEQTKSIINNIYGESNESIQISLDCFENTQGNPKEIELFLLQNNNAILNHSYKLCKITTLKNYLNQMPEIQRYLVLLSTLFPSGIKIDYLYNFVNNMYVTDSESIEIALNKIITLGYVIINSKNNNILKPAHDKIGLDITKFENDENFIEFYQTIEKTLEELIVKKNNSSDYVYLLHCLIGVCNFKDLQRNIDYLVDLINTEYNNCSYFYVTEIVSHEKEIVNYLPKSTVLQILDSCQKSSEFILGLSICRQLEEKSSSSYKGTMIYAVKFMTQMYDFDNALEMLEELPRSNKTIMYKLNILQHQGKNQEAKVIVDELLKTNCKDKWYYIILRNSAHYYDYNTAENNLNNCLNYFKTSGSAFELATIYNNLSVIEIWNGRETYLKAKNNVDKAICIHSKIQSNEIFEPYCNKSVLHFLESDVKSALKYADLALQEVPHKLDLDLIILKLNKYIYQYALDSITLLEFYEYVKDLHMNSMINKDPWVKFQVEYNMHNIEEELYGNSDIDYTSYYINGRKNYTGFEVFSSVKSINVSLSLSPNWRY